MQVYCTLNAFSISFSFSFRRGPYFFCYQCLRFHGVNFSQQSCRKFRQIYNLIIIIPCHSLVGLVSTNMSSFQVFPKVFWSHNRTLWNAECNNLQFSFCITYLNTVFAINELRRGMTSDRLDSLLDISFVQLSLAETDDPCTNTDFKMKSKRCLMLRRVEKLT